MHDRGKIQAYVNNFRRHLTGYLRPGIGLAARIHPALGPGAILEFQLGAPTNDDTYQAPSASVNAALVSVPQRMFGGNIENVRFGGTNISMEPDRIILIKGEDDDGEWDDSAAKRDVGRILSGMRR